MSETRVRLTVGRIGFAETQQIEVVLRDATNYAFQFHRGRQLRVYEVFSVDDVLRKQRLGLVIECTETLERKTPGKRYVNARWTGAKTVWRPSIDGGGRVGMPQRTRADAIARVMAWDHGRPTRQSEWAS